MASAEMVRSAGSGAVWGWNICAGAESARRRKAIAMGTLITLGNGGRLKEFFEERLHGR